MSEDTGGLLGYARVGGRPHKQVKSEDIYNLLQQWSTLLQAGMALVDALDLSAAQTQSTRLAAVVREIAGKVKAGIALNEAAAEYPQYFEPHWIQIIRTGELCGELGPLITRLASHMKESRESRSKVVSAMIYPSIIAVVAVSAIVIMLWFVVPTFTQFFTQTGSELPGITRAVIGVSDFLQHYGLYILGVIIVLAFAFRKWKKTENGAYTFACILMAIPLIGDMLVQSCMERFATNLGLLLRAGMPLLESLYSLDGVFLDNPPVRESLREVRRRVSSGGSLSGGLKNSPVFTPMVVHLVAVGEESGDLPKVLDHLSGYYKHKVAAIVTRVTGMMEPVIILFMGVTVAVILTAIYLPMFNMGGAVK